MKIVISFNCQTPGIAEALFQLNPSYKILNIPLFNINDPLFRVAAQKEIESSDYWITDSIPEFFSSVKKKIKIIEVPMLTYPAFYPDISGISGKNGEKTIRKYHSGIVAAAYKNNMPLQEVPSLFNKINFNKLGFFNAHEDSFNNLKNQFSKYGLEKYFYDFFYEVKKNGIFMYTASHPNSYGHACIAKLINKIIGNESNVTPKPKDYLSYFQWSLYPDLSIYHGIEGQYRWLLKDATLPNEINILGLELFCQFYYQQYDQDEVMRNRSYIIKNELGTNFEKALF
jgi:hypothetical protein